ncbi:MAG: hypothetical protein H0U73_05280 [Tatlockia sp.]|nr:hypothetical protein [Tatlockia sp.]
MYEKRLENEYTTFSPSNSFIFSLLEDLFKSQSQIDDEQLIDTINSLREWKVTKKNKIESFSAKEKEQCQKDIFWQMEAILKLNLYFKNNLPYFASYAINVICEELFTILISLSDERSLEHYLIDTENTIYNVFDTPVVTDDAELKTRVFICHAIKNVTQKTLLPFRKITRLGLSMDYPRSELDLDFLDNVFAWSIKESKSTSNQNCKIYKLESKFRNFIIQFKYSDISLFILDSIEIRTKHKKTAYCLTDSLNKAGIKFGVTPKFVFNITDLTPEKFSLLMPILLRFAPLNRKMSKKLFSIIKCYDPAKDAHDLLIKGEYELAISKACEGVEKGFKDCLWNLAEQMKEKFILDQAFLAYNSIDIGSPFFKEAKLQCFHIIEKILFSASTLLSQQEITEFKEYQFRLLLDICKFGKTDPQFAQFEKLKDSLFSELCGKTTMYAEINGIQTKGSTLLNIARAMRQKEQKPNESKSRNQIELMKPIKNSLPLVNHGLFANFLKDDAQKTLISSSNSLILLTIENMYKQNSEIDLGSEVFNETILSLKKWAQEKSLEIQNSSQKEKELLQKNIFNDMEMTLKLYMFFNINLPDFNIKVINSLCNIGFTLMVKLSDNNFLERFVLDTQFGMNPDKNKQFINYAIQNATLGNEQPFLGFERFGCSKEYPKSDFDLDFLDNVLGWGILEIKEKEKTVIVESKVKHFFKFNFVYEKSSSDMDYIVVVPGGSKNFTAFETALNENNIGFIEQQREVIYITAITKEILCSFMQVLLCFAPLNKDLCSELDSIIGCFDPAIEVNEFIMEEKYELAIERANIGVRLGFKDCLWNLAEDLHKKNLFDKALLAYDLIEKNNPFYKEAKIQSFNIITRIMSFNTFSEPEIIVYKERQFILLLDLCKFDSDEYHFRKLKDGLFSELCGKSMSKIESNAETLLDLARTMRQPEDQIVSKQTKNCVVARFFRASPPITNTTSTTSTTSTIGTSSTF